MTVSLSSRHTDQLPALTSLRGWLALWVVAYHFWNDATRLFPGSAIASPFVALGHMAVPAFFILSGFVLSYNYADQFRTLRLGGAVSFWGRRLARIYPVHLATLLAVAAMVAVCDWVGFRLTDAGYSTRDFVRNLALIQTWVPNFRLNWNYPSWSISSEWFAYLVFPFAATWLLVRLTSTFRALAFGLICLAGAVVLYTVGRELPFWELLCVLPTFFAGAAIDRCARTRPTSRGPIRLPEILLLAIPTVCFLASGATVTGLLLVLLFALIASLVWAGSRCHAHWASRPALFLGEVSYSLYMTHTLAQKVLYKLLPSTRFESADLSIRVGVAAGYIGLIFIACLLSYYLIERPCRYHLRHVFSGARGPAARQPAQPIVPLISPHPGPDTAASVSRQPVHPR